MNNRRVLGMALLCGMLLAGCGEFSYKRGAGPGDLESARKSCEAKGGTTAEMEKCMEDSGWTVQRLEQFDPIAVLSLNKDNRSPEATTSTDQLKSTDKLTTQTPADPMDKFVINSWWKIGSGGDSLRADMDACTGKLGEQHQPDTKTQTVTRALLFCMRDHGWRGLRSK